MRCEEARLLISAGLDKELEGIGVAQLRTHLAECRTCSFEQDALAATVRLLRELPAADPPPGLRRRIGYALQEIERSADGRRTGFAWFPRPRVPAWALGAALGAGLAAIVGVAPWHPSPRREMKIAHNPVSFVVTPVKAPSRLGHEVPTGPKSAVVPKKPAPHAVEHPEPNLTANLPPPTPIVPEASPSVMPSHPVETLIHKPQRSVRPSPPHRSVATHRLSPTPRPNVPSTTVAGGAPSDRRPQSSDDSSRLAQNTPLASNDGATTPSTDGGSPMDTNGMTLMAQGPAIPTTPEPPDNDLVELRRRLEDRPVQIPELGQLKPATGTHANHDGWIRF